MTTRRPKAEPFPAFLDLWERFCLDGRDPSVVVVVEGPRDAAALARLGYPGRVERLHEGRSLPDRAQALVDRARRVVVLTDWDTEGGHLAQRLRELLEAGPAVVDLDLRRRLGIVLRGELVHVEGLDSWARHAAEKAGGPLDHFLDARRRDGRLPTG